MNAKQTSKLSMYLALETVLITFLSLLSAFKKFTNFFETLQDGIKQIRKLDKQQVSSKSGIAVNKAQLRAALITGTADLCRKIRAYSTIENNQILLGETKISESDLRKCNDNVLLDIAQATYNNGFAHLNDLGSYDYTEIMQTALLEIITDFGASIPTTRMGTIDTKQSTTQLAIAFAEIDEAITNIDILVEVLKLSQPEFYSNYKSARKIINLGSGSLLVKGFVTNSATGEGLKNVKVTFVLDSVSTGSMKVNGINATQIVEKKTAEKGRFNVKSLPEGTYSIFLKKAGYLDQVTKLNVTHGEMAVLNVELVKNA